MASPDLLSHSDVHGILGHTPMTTHIPGHEGVGQVIQVGSNVPQHHLKRRVGVKWIYSTCGECEICDTNSTACPYQHNSGRDVEGTFQQYMVSPVQHLTEIPEHMEGWVAAPLLCAGLTIYSAIAKANLSLGDWMVLPGAGGGLGHLGLQIAKKKGYRVLAIDTGRDKRQLCLALGATEFLDYKTDDIEKSVKGLTSGYGAHAVICTAGSFGAYQQGLSLLRNLGTLVCVGLVDKHLPVSPLEVVIRGLRIIGSSVGTATEMQEMLDMAVAEDVTPTVEVFDFETVDEVLQKLARSEIAGRAVLKIPSKD